jgi:hypothetical protein
MSMPPQAPAAVTPEAASGLSLSVFAFGFSPIAFCGPHSYPIP